MKKFYELDTITRSLIKAVARASGYTKDILQADNTVFIGVCLHHPLKKYGDILSIAITKNKQVSVAYGFSGCPDYDGFAEDNRIDDIIFYFVGENGINDVVYINVREEA